MRRWIILLFWVCLLSCLDLHISSKYLHLYSNKEACVLNQTSKSLYEGSSVDFFKTFLAQHLERNNKTWLNFIFFNLSTCQLMYDVIFQKWRQVFHWGFPTLENRWNHKVEGRVLLLFSSVWKPWECVQRLWCSPWAKSWKMVQDLDSLSLNIWLTKFIQGVANKTAGPYPPCSM